MTYIVESDEFVSVLVRYVCWDWAVCVRAGVLHLSFERSTTTRVLTKLWPEYGKSSLPGPLDMLLSLAIRLERG